jgi:H+/Cl- antiporter ClcA
MGRESAPKQAGAVFANLFADIGKLSDEQRSLLVACGAGASMAAAYGVPLGGALFSLEVMRGKLALRFVLPALLASLIATGVSWIFLPNAPSYTIPSFPPTASGMVWAIVAAPFFAFASILYIRLVRWADRGKPRGWSQPCTLPEGQYLKAIRPKLYLMRRLKTEFFATCLWTC